MHYPIRVIVTGATRDEALQNAESYADDLVEKGEFDYYNTNGRFGKARPYTVTSKKGIELIEGGMEGSRREFDKALTHVRYMVEHFTPEQIYEEDFGTEEEVQAIKDAHKDLYHLSRYMFAKVDGVGNGSYVYAEHNLWGGAIENQRALKHVLSKDNLWVVLLDMHN